MPQLSAGLLMFRRKESGLEVFLVHPGGPFWRKKDLGAWSIPKGLPVASEALLEAARREFKEETGITSSGPFIDLGEAKQAGGKIVRGWAFENDCSPQLVSNFFTMEWPPKSGRSQQFPEVDRGEWFSLAAARERINSAQRVFLDRLVPALRS